MFLNLLLYLLADGAITALQRAMQKRRRAAYRPGTMKNQWLHIKMFVAFCLHFGLAYIQPTVNTICLYIEFLAQSLKSPASVRNYVAGISTFHKLMDLPCQSLNAFPVELMLRAINLTLTLQPVKRLPITVKILRDVCGQCEKLGELGRTVKCALLFGFFGFLRRSNLAPGNTFDRSRHTCRGDVLEAGGRLALLLKWTKTLQNRDKAFLVPLPTIPNHSLCPLAAYRRMCVDIPTTDENQPLFMVRTASGSPQPLTDSHLARMFKNLLTAAGYNHQQYSLHSLRSGGASASFKANTDPLYIQRHGTWRSDVFWKYIVTDSVNDSDLADKLRKLVENSIHK